MTQLYVLQSLRAIVDDKDFPFHKSWDLNTKELKWYLTPKQVERNNWAIERRTNHGDHMLYYENVIKDHPVYCRRNKATCLEADSYVFVSDGKVKAWWMTPQRHRGH